MDNNSLYDRLIEYGKNGNYAFHMPGHKRNVKFLDEMDAFQIDITEINEFDNLHCPEGIIKEAMNNAAGFFGVHRTWFLINGSSSGILAAINAVTKIGDSIIVGRNCHKSVYNAVMLRNLKAHYLYPEYIENPGIDGGYDAERLKNLFCKNQNIKAVVITSPTYEGIVSDIEKIARITHENGAVLIVDQAHGAHFGVTSQLPTPAYKLGADLVIESLHKTLPAFTQTALLHLQGKNIDEDIVEKYLGIYQTSSPSYVFMASIDKCIRVLQREGKEQMHKLLIMDDEFRNHVNKLKYIWVPGKELKGKKHVFDVDTTKLVICIDPSVRDGKWLADILRTKYHFEMEMISVGYTLGITTICDNRDEIIRLGESLRKIDEYLQKGRAEQKRREYNANDFVPIKNEIGRSIYEADKSMCDKIKLCESAGYVSGEFLYLYPPGIPLLVPGEIISDGLLNKIYEYRHRGMDICGLTDKENKYIKVLKK